MENILIWDKVNRRKNTEVILYLLIGRDDIKKGGHNVMPPFHIYQILFII